MKKSIELINPIFSVRYSYHRPNILAACDEQGYMTLIDANAGYKNLSNELQNTLKAHQIDPMEKFQVHDNTIFDFDWCFSDNKIITASGDMQCMLVNMEHGSNRINEAVFSGHRKSVKSVKQSFYNNNIFASCGRDGVILLWDLRKNNRKHSEDPDTQQVSVRIYI